MQIERLAKDPEYARNQFERGGAFFQLMTECVFTPAQVVEYAPAIAADVVHITGKRPPLSPNEWAVLQELEKHTVDCVAPLVAFTLGMMLGVGQERARRKGARA